MPWKYRVMRHQDDADAFYAIHEFYDIDGKTSWTENPVAVIGSSVEGMQEVMAMMIEAFKKPVLDYKTGEVIILAKASEEEK